MKITDIQGDWPSFKKAVQEHYDRLDDAQAEVFRNRNRAKLMELMDTRYGLASPQAEAELDEIMARKAAAENSDRHG